MVSTPTARATLVALLFLVVDSKAQTTWHVDASATPPGNGSQASPYASIQFALSHPTTLSGDTIVVAPGVYAEEVRFFGKEVVVRSTGGAQATFIDVSSLGFEATPVNFVDGEQLGARVEGFTLFGGNAGTFGFGGGVLCDGSRGELRGCAIVACGSFTDFGQRGGGVAVVANARLDLVETTVQSCVVDAEGGGLYVEDSTVRLDRCVVSFCESLSEMGGALSARNAIVEIVNSSFLSNRTTNNDGGAIHAENTIVRIADSAINSCGAVNDYRGGALALVGTSQATIERTLFELNNSARGGALYIAPSAVASIERCNFRENWASSLQALDGSGGAIYSEGSSTVLTSVFTRNSANSGPSGDARGGAVFACSVDRCTFFDNRCDVSFGDGAAAANSTLHNSIVWGNTPTARSLTSCTVSWSDVEGGASGTGNLSADPLFVFNSASEPRLSPGSPCIDIGNPNSPSDPDGSRADLGAFEFYPSYGAALIELCVGKVTSTICAPFITSGSAPPSLSGGLFEIVGRNLPEHRPGLMFWGLSPAAIPFQGGTLCVAAPRARTPLQVSTAGSGLSGCNGAFSFQWTNAYASAVGLASFTHVYCQFWFRDPADLFKVGLSNAVRFTTLP